MQRKFEPMTGWQKDLVLILLPALMAFAFCIIDPNIFGDGDTNWNLATGLWILQHHAVPRADPFSYTAFGKAWTTHEWLSEVFMALAYRAAGWSGVVVLIGGALAAAAALLANELKRWLGVLSIIASLGLAFGLLLPHLLARPHMLALPMLVFWLVRMMHARERGPDAPRLWLLPVMAFWANLHGSWVFGVAFSCFFALDAFVESPGRRLAVGLDWGGFLLGLLIAACLTPNGPAALVFPFQVMSLSADAFITEWMPVNFGKISPIEIVLIFTLFVCLSRGVRMGWVRVALLLLLLHMALQHIRQEIILSVAAPLLLAEPLGRALEPGRGGQPQTTAWPPLVDIVAPAAVFCVLILGLTVAAVLGLATHNDSRVTPANAVAHVPPQLAALPVFNSYSFGGWLVFKGVRPFIDGRADMYGDAFVQTYVDAERVKSPEIALDTLDRYKVAWTILTPKVALVDLLDRTPGWRRLYADKWAVVQVRDAAAQSSH
jgi:hypothetical protein